MRACPPCQVELRHFGAWHGALCVLGLIGTAALAAWLAAQPSPLPIEQLALAAAAELAMLACAWRLWPVPRHDLRWTGRCWELDAAAGDLGVAIDLGAWMLLRFVPHDAAARGAWLPVQRRGLEAQWHALRCAVYSPRPAPER